METRLVCFTCQRNKLQNETERTFINGHVVQQMFRQPYVQTHVFWKPLFYAKRFNNFTIFHLRRDRV